MNLQNHDPPVNQQTLFSQNNLLHHSNHQNHYDQDDQENFYEYTDEDLFFGNDEMSP